MDIALVKSAAKANPDAFIRNSSLVLLLKRLLKKRTILLSLLAGLFLRGQLSVLKLQHSFQKNTPKHENKIEKING